MPIHLAAQLAALPSFLGRPFLIGRLRTENIQFSIFSKLKRGAPGNDMEALASWSRTSS